MARTSVAGGTSGGPAAVERVVSVDSLDRQVMTIGPADGSDSDSIGALTETVPATDTASSGLNGRLQRIAQRLTSLMSGLAITPISSSSLEASHILKSSAGSLYSLYCLANSVDGYLMTFNAVSAPVDGPVTPIDCIKIPAGQVGNLNFGNFPDAYSTGIVAVFSTSGPFTKTASATAFFKGRVI